MSLGGFFGGETEGETEAPGVAEAAFEAAQGRFGGVSVSEAASGGIAAGPEGAAGDRSPGAAEIAQNVLSFLVNPLSIIGTLTQEMVSKDTRSFEQQTLDREATEAASAAADVGGDQPAPAPRGPRKRPTSSPLAGAPGGFRIHGPATAGARTSASAPDVPNLATASVVSGVQEAAARRRAAAGRQTTRRTAAAGLSDFGTVLTTPQGLPDIANAVSLAGLPNRRKKTLLGS